MTELALFQCYDYYNTMAAKRDLTPSEKRFLYFCQENHVEICDYENLPDNSEILTKATELFDEID